MTYDEALEYIHSVSWKGSVPGLTRITELMHRLGDPQKRLQFIHIVGTNGKGSTAAMLDSILRAAHYKTGLFTSPFLLCFRERMQAGGEMISEQALADVTQYVRPFADAMQDKPTEFELITAIALVWFAQQACDIVVLEAGMGGALDSTNVIPAPQVAVFTNIGLDHMQILGDTVEKIAATKAGILKPGCDAVAYRSGAAVEQVLAHACEATGVALHLADFSQLLPQCAQLSGQQFSFGTLQTLTLPLLGEHQLRNAAVAITVIQVLRRRGWTVCDDAIRTGLSGTAWPGRFEVLSRAPLFVLDGGHNPQCIEALTHSASQYLAGRELTVLTGVLADKDYCSMYDAPAQLAARFITVTPPNPRALSAEALAAFLRSYQKPVTVCDSVEAGVSAAVAAAGTDGAVLAFGSLYMAGRIRDAVLKRDAC